MKAKEKQFKVLVEENNKLLQSNQLTIENRIQDSKSLFGIQLRDKLILAILFFYFSILPAEFIKKKLLN